MFAFVFLTNPYRPTYPLKPHGSFPLLLSSCNCSTHHRNPIHTTKYFPQKKALSEVTFFLTLACCFWPHCKSQKKKSLIIAGGLHTSAILPFWLRGISKRGIDSATPQLGTLGLALWGGRQLSGRWSWENSTWLALTHCSQITTHSLRPSGVLFSWLRARDSLVDWMTDARGCLP